MTFCCGASMIGTIGSIQTEKVFVQQIPIVYCPVCKGIQIHPKIQDEFYILVEFAEGDRVNEIQFTDYIDLDKIGDLAEICSSWDDGDHERLLREQIDHSLDLLSLAKSLGDEEWESQLKERLRFFSDSFMRWKQVSSPYPLG